MSEDRLDYGEVLCEAVDTIISKKLEKLAYDITKTCIVTDDTYKKQGRYTVADGALKFEAYSTITTLNINDNVLVNIPNGDYNNQKTILNKVIVDERTSSLNYTSPLSNMLKFTNNILDDITPSILDTDGTFSILANDDLREKLLYEFNSWEDYSGFSRLGISVNFHTRLNHQYKIISGNYGIKIKMYSGTTIRELDFNTNDMVGNPYQFDTFVNQTKLFDISKTANVSKVEIYLYQDNNFFDEYNEKLPTETEGDTVLNISSNKIDDNILINNFEIYLGYSLSEFNGDSVIISTPGYASYSKLDVDKEKLLNLRWIHQVDENTYITYTQKDIIKENLNIYWFRYVLNQTKSKDTEIAGAPNWSKSPAQIAQERDLDKFKSSFYPDYNNTQERIRAVCSIINELGEEEYFRSNDLVFDNELATVDMLTFNAAKGLTIECLDGSEGNYFIYNQSGKIINEGRGQGYKRNLEVKFDGLPLNEGLKNIASVTWTLPLDSEKLKKYTMLSYGEDQIGNPSSEDYEKGYITIPFINTDKTQEIDKSATIQSYSIKNNWHSANSQNLIKCEVSAGDILYEASLDLQFGKAGSSGTNLTLVLDFDNNENAIIYDDENRSEIVKAVIYDMAGNKIETPTEGWTWTILNDDNSIICSQTDVPSQIKLTLSENFDIMKAKQNFNILKADYKQNEDDTFSISAFLPIAIKSKIYSYLEGAKEIIYNSQGVLDYQNYTDAYILYDNEKKETDAEWTLVQNGVNASLQLQDLNKNNKTYKALSANPFYIKNQENKACVYAEIEGNIAWSQPILVMQSQYDYATLNNWNGNVEIGTSSIMSTMLGVGKKNAENQFSGIIIGDLEALAQETAEDDGVEETTGVGLYGLTDGIVSFSLTDKGIATFGGQTNNNGLIMLGGNGNTITSSNGNYFINIDKGFNSVSYNNENERLLLSSDNEDYTNYLSLFDKASNKILQFEKNNYLINSSTGDLQINLNNGKIIANNKLILNDSSTSALKVGSLNIDWDGNVVINQIKLNNMTLSSGNTSIAIGDNFAISSTGVITYKGKDLDTYINELIAAANTTNP